MKTKRMKIVISFVLVFALVLSMFVVSFADTAPNFTANSPFTLYTTTSDEVTLQAGPADATYTFVGYETAAEAAAGVDWSIVSGSSDIIASVSEPTGAAVTVTIGGVAVTRYASQITVDITASASAYGAASILAQDESNPYNYVNFTLVLPNSGTPDNADVAAVLRTSSEDFAVDNDAVTTDISTATGALKYATPIDVLDGITSAAAVTTDFDKYISSYSSYGGYVSSITGSDGSQSITLSAQNSPPYSGWNYRVYHNETMDPLSAVVSAAEYRLSDGDVVVWFYGSYSEALTFFNDFYE